jgi:hypothetical protein
VRSFVVVIRLNQSVETDYSAWVQHAHGRAKAATGELACQYYSVQLGTGLTWRPLIDRTCAQSPTKFVFTTCTSGHQVLSVDDPVRCAVLQLFTMFTMLCVCCWSGMSLRPCNDTMYGTTVSATLKHSNGPLLVCISVPSDC